MKSGVSKTRKSLSRVSRGRPMGTPSRPELTPFDQRPDPEKEEFKWLAELHTVLSPYWSARFGK